MMTIDLWASPDENIHNVALGAMRVIQRVGVDCRLQYKGLAMTVTPNMVEADIVNYFERQLPQRPKHES